MGTETDYKVETGIEYPGGDDGTGQKKSRLKKKNIRLTTNGSSNSSGAKSNGVEKKSGYKAKKKKGGLKEEFEKEMAKKLAREEPQSLMNGAYAIRTDIAIPDELLYPFPTMEKGHCIEQPYESEDEILEIKERFIEAVENFKRDNEDVATWNFGIKVYDGKDQFVRLFRLQ